MTNIIEKLVYGSQPEQFSEFEIIFTFLIPLILFILVKQQKKQLFLSILILFTYFIFITFSISKNINYQGSDRIGNCGWIQLENIIDDGQSAYRLQANRFIQSDEIIKNLKVSFYYAPTYKPIYELLCKLDNFTFTVINLLFILLSSVLLSFIFKENLFLNLVLLFTGFNYVIWVYRQGQFVSIEMCLLIFSLYFYKNENINLGNIFLFIFGICRVYFLIIFIPLIFINKFKSKLTLTIFFGIMLIFSQLNLWSDYFYLWFSEDGYIFGDVTAYSNRTSLFDEHLGRYAFSIFLIIRFIFSTLNIGVWSSNLLPSFLILMTLIIVLNYVILKKIKDKTTLEIIIIFLMLNFLLYPVLKPYIFGFYIILTIGLFEFRTKEYKNFSIYCFTILSFYGFLITNLISSTLSMEIYQLILLLIHFSFTISSKYEKRSTIN